MTRARGVVPNEAAASEQTSSFRGLGPNWQQSRLLAVAKTLGESNRRREIRRRSRQAAVRYVTPEMTAENCKLQQGS